MISVVILTHNDEHILERTFASVAWCDELIVIDDESTDQTTAIAKRFHAKVWTRALSSDFAAQRNFGLSKASGDWILFLDSDEVVTEELQKEILKKTETSAASGFYIQRTDVLYGKELRFGETAHVSLLRLARKDVGTWSRPVHEVWEVHGNTENIQAALLHYPHETLSEFIHDINIYSTLHAKNFFDQGRRTNVLEIILFPLGKFIQNYIVRMGFRDGMQGTVVAFMMSFHSFLSKGKLYMLWQVADTSN